jgi:hypothetical protein
VSYRTFGSLIVAGTTAMALASVPAAQTNWRPHLKSLPEKVITPTKTPEGWPDLQGAWNVVKRIGGPQHSLEYGIDPEATAIHDWNPAAREASIVIDPPNGRIPYNPAAMEKRNANLAGVYIPTKRSHLDPEVRCLLGGVPRGTLQGTEIRYAPPYVAFISIGRTSDQSFTRLIPMDGRPWPNEQLKLWRGISRGRFEGNTLVVETRNQNDKTWFDSHGSFHSDQMQVIERLTLVDGETMYYEATIIDPTVFTQPWKLATTWNRTKNQDRVWEEGCHEGERDSYHMLEAGIRAANAGHKGIHEHHAPGSGKGTFAPVVTDQPAKSREELFKR